MSNVIRISDYSIMSDDQFFFDANIWILLFCPIASSRRRKQEVYSNFLEYIKSRSRPIHLNALVISELINAWLHISHKAWVSTVTNGRTDYKRDFVGSTEYLVEVRAIQSAVNNILSFCIRNNDDFNAINLQTILSGLTVRDFNDNYYLELASNRGFKIVSDDGDLFDRNTQTVTILTA